MKGRKKSWSAFQGRTVKRKKGGSRPYQGKACRAPRFGCWQEFSKIGSENRFVGGKRGEGVDGQNDDMGGRAERRRRRKGERTARAPTAAL